MEFIFDSESKLNNVVRVFDKTLYALDLHWMDEYSEEAVIAMVESISEANQQFYMAGSDYDDICFVSIKSAKYFPNVNVAYPVFKFKRMPDRVMDIPYWLCEAMLDKVNKNKEEADQLNEDEIRDLIYYALISIFLNAAYNLK